MLAIGLMSGTSLDGVDVSLVKITKRNKYRYKEIDSLFVPYSEELKQRILDASKLNTSNVQKICSLNVELGYVYLDAIKKLLSNLNLDSSMLSFIAMHGQTIWHNPNQMDGYYSSTLQIGDPSIIAYNLNVEVISNFRMMDMAAKGCGAPLVPFVNYLLNQDEARSIAFQNIGGVSNVTYIPKKCSNNMVIAFDNGPGNLLIDQAMQILYHKPFDENGAVASLGCVNNQVLDELMNDDYILRPYPKSTGREKYNNNFVMNIIEKMKNEPKQNIIATITAYTADVIIDSVTRFYSDIDELIVSGGGANNSFIMNRLKNKLKCKVSIYKKSDSYEAFCFCVLGHRTYIKEPSNLPCVTGAESDVILGNITYPPRKKEK
ncbi:MAG: anhydro-N-acetylmuramic acid kinase [Bacilli bacterium]